MCGIVGYIGKNASLPFLLEGLGKLEYRGYDSAGVALLENGSLKFSKAKGRLDILKEKLSKESFSGNIGIGHTRWATHGAPSDKNSHPHISRNNKIAIVHNGIIENYSILRKHLVDLGFTFSSDTDSEVVAHLLEYYYNDDMIDAISRTVEKLQGSFALGIVSVDHPGELFAVKKDSPLIVGIGENENFIASDIPALLSKTRDVYLLKDGDIVCLTESDIKIYSSDKKEIKRDKFHVDWDIDAAEKGGFEHFMLKEIHEQPKTVRDTISSHISNGKVVFEGLDMLSTLKRVYITACGSAYHVGLAGKYIIEKLAGVPVDVWLASEFRYAEPVVSEGDLVVLISQSGETADTLAALREAKNRGAKTLAIVNVAGSSIAREADFVVHTLAGPEIAVATTKAYSCQLAMIYLLAIYMASGKDNISAEEEKVLCNDLIQLPDKIEETIKLSDTLKEHAKNHYNISNAFYLGRGIDWCVSLEGSLKLKEISYVHSESYAAGELKHGTISLIEENSLVVSIATQKNIFDKTISNIKEVKSRGAYVMLLLPEGSDDGGEADCKIYLPQTNDLFSASLSVVALQIFAYYVAHFRGCDIDKPRNLAKSVTVE